jgi:hypothetical protein
LVSVYVTTSVSEDVIGKPGADCATTNAGSAAAARVKIPFIAFMAFG